ncbi:MAG TPA: nucleotidyltransferase domain-containing protein [Candidatus Lokiarchaeia archaeon]
MVGEDFLDEIREDFSKIIGKKNILGILLFGSYLNGEETNRSDKDICIVAPEEDEYRIFSEILEKINIGLKKYDIHFFSALPLYIKIQIIESGIVIYSSDELELFEYFYKYRKLWSDQAERQKLTKEDLLSLLE